MKACLYFVNRIYFLVILGSFSLYAQDNQIYKVSNISYEMKINAKAVYREEKIVFEIESPEKAHKEVHYAITILNENGIDDARFIQKYDKFSKIRRINGTIFDKDGKKVRKISNTEISDQSAVSGYSVYENNRIKFIDPKYHVVPFTIEYEYDIDYNGIINYPDWVIYKDYNTSIEKSTFQVKVPEDMKFRYMIKNMDLKPVITRETDLKIYSWEIRNQKAQKKESFSLGLASYTPVVYTGPVDFEIEGFYGNCESWKNFGLWFYDLNKGNNHLSPDSESRIRELVKDVPNDYAKIKILYKYLQNKTRYVSIQVGLGGWQPIDANIVDRLSYGDCKALTNYMKSMLEIAGIKSYYTLVNAGNNAGMLITDFPSNQFNHTILCVPYQKDTIWLECTSQYNPAGYIGTFTDDRKVLVINDKGGKLVNTISYTGKDHVRIRHITIYLEENGDGNAIVDSEYKGIFFDDLSAILHQNDKEKLNELNKRISIPSYELKNFSHKQSTGSVPSIQEQINLCLKNYCTILGNRMIVQLNLMNKIDEIPPRTDTRISKISIRRPITEIDTISYLIPKSYSVNKLPENFSVHSEFGEYNYELKVNNNQVKYIRCFKLNKGLYSPDKYTDFVDFFEKISQAEEVKMLLIKM